MYIPNFSSLACLEVAEKFVVVVGWLGGVVGHLATVSNLNPRCVALSLVELGLGFDNIFLTGSRAPLSFYPEDSVLFLAPMRRYQHSARGSL